MSYGITPIAVSLEEVQNAIGAGWHRTGLLGWLLGSPTNSLVKTIKQKFGYRFEQDDVLDEEEPPLEKALSDLLTGADLNPAYGHKYAYAFELLCSHLGEFLDNSAWSAMRLEWSEHVHETMIQAGIDEETLSINDHLMFRGPPVPIPTPDDSPSIGFLRKSEITKAANAIDAADLSALDEETTESVMQIRGWLERCKELQCDLVCFYY